MAIEVRVPTLGESVSEATVATWFKKPGDMVAVDEMLCELETDKVTVEVPAPASGRLAEIVAAEVSPGMAIMSKPTEQTQVMASSFSMVRLPRSAAAIMPASSLTGMKAPDNPPTARAAINPPFLTASFSNARAAVVPGAPQLSSPISSSM